MEDLNNIRIKEYVSIILRRPNTPKIWVNKRVNPNKEFYKHWQCPGGHVEDTDISAKHAAQREVLEETGIRSELEELEYTRTNHYFREKEWRIVHCYSLTTKKVPELTEPREMTDWQLKKIKEVQKEPIIDSLKDAFKGRQHETKIIMIEGSCGAGKSTFVGKCKEYLTKYKKTVEILDESFITKDSSKRIINYGSNLKKYKEKEITKEQMEEIAIELEEWIRDKWMKQIFEFYTRERKPSILLMDRNLFSTLIFMKLMEEEGFFSKEKQEEVSTNYNNWSWLIRESLVIWWKTPVEETIKRVEKRGRTGEEDLKYYKNLDEVYRKLMLEIYPNLKVITRETQLTTEQVEELIPNLLDEKIFRRTGY
ncbi:hypothetical protein Glove_375g74 [Diversispora epigaea]|uniref:Nudix hydrolase domain-containing protein n=1 Tax=Diversispora epigaea TaxID=1348612 RepID=A0A397H928_9GLOM|nr:hypothetical protein Glove_375g74 [Diversispora epigaea]